MDKKLFLALFLVCGITHTVRSVYEILKHKGTIIPGKLSFVIIFINMILLWVSWFLLCSHDICTIIFPAIIRYAGIFLSGIGLIAFLIALFTIKTLESYDGDLIKTGIYSKIRHPMYLGFVLWLIGFPIFFGAFFSMLIALLFILNVLFWRYLEEIELKKRFPAYIDYKKTTLF